jgi:hypothetical protein
MDDFIDIPAGTVAQVRRALGGRMVLIEDDVQNVARDLQAISDDLHLHFDAAQDLWVVMQDRDGTETLVTTTRELDQRLVHRVRQVCSPSYDLAGELERVEAQADRQEAQKRSERAGEVGERLAHAFRTDLGEKRNF